MQGPEGPQGPAGPDIVKRLNSNNYRNIEIGHYDYITLEESINITSDFNNLNRKSLRVVGGGFKGSTAERVARHAPCPVLVVRGTDPDDGFPRHLLVATDFSPESEGALDVAREIALRHGSSVTVGHVYDDGPILLGEHAAITDTAAVDAELRDKLNEAMKQKLADVAEVKVALLAGASPVVGLCDLAGKESVDLIVTATHGRSGVARALMGSVAERLVRHAPCSVLVVRRR